MAYHYYRKKLGVVGKSLTPLQGPESALRSIHYEVRG